MKRGGGRGGPGGGGGGGGYYGSDSSVGNKAARGGYAASEPPLHMQQDKSDHHSGHHHWRWERDGSSIQSPMSPHMFNEGSVTGTTGQGSEASRSYHQEHRLDPRITQKEQGSNDASRGEIMGFWNERDPTSQTFDGIEKKFLDDIMKLSKEQNDLEDAEIARHRERINAINSNYQEQLVALRARHATHRDELLQSESHSRRQQYQQATADHFRGDKYGRSDPQGYSDMSATPTDPHRSYPGDDYHAYRDRHRFLGSARNHELESRGQYPGSHMHDTGARYY